jgi:hypothetical protein
METMSGKIRSILGDGSSKTSDQTMQAEGLPPVSVVADSKCSSDKMDTEPLVTEPTPPSTIDHDGAMDYD